MEKEIIIKKIEDNAHHFLTGIKKEYAGTKEAGKIIHKYVHEGKITADEEHTLKLHMVESLKFVGVVVPFVLIPGASILMPILIKVAGKHNIDLIPSAFSNKDATAVIIEVPKKP